MWGPPVRRLQRECQVLEPPLVALCLAVTHDFEPVTLFERASACAGISMEAEDANFAVNARWGVTG